MMRAMYTAISGLKAHQLMLDTTANDLANVSTVGYKGTRSTFQDTMSQLQHGGSAASAQNGGSNAQQVGLGVTVGSIDNLMGSGSFQVSGGALDVAVQGGGWFRTGTGAPTAGTPTAGTPGASAITFTRAGNFGQNDNGYMTTQDGNYVLGKVAPDAGGAGVADCYIQVPKNATDVQIGSDGAVSFLPPAGFTQPATLPPIGADGRAIAGYLSLSTFPNEPGLQRVSDNRWAASASSGAETSGTPGGNYGSTISGVLEMSNVDMATDMTQMITAQRGFQANSKVITTSDTMLQSLVDLIR